METIVIAMSDMGRKELQNLLNTNSTSSASIYIKREFPFSNGTYTEKKKNLYREKKINIVIKELST